MAPTLERKRHKSWRRHAALALVALCAVGQSLVAVDPAAAAGNPWAGRQPYGDGRACLANERVIGNYRAWGSGGDVGAYVELHHSYTCGTAWLIINAPFRQYTGASYIWNPGYPAYSAPLVTGAWAATPMADDRPGVETCLGTHLYRYGSYFSWTFHLCYR